MSTPRVGAGVIGLGFGEKVHVPGLRRAGAEVVAVCARTGAQEAAERLGVPRAYEHWHDLVRDDAVHLVSIASPPATHHEIAVAAAAAGKAVLCEKPLATTVADAEQMVAAAGLAGVPTLVDFEFRAVPSFVRAAELVAEGALGDVAQLEVRWTLAHHKRPPGAAWKEDRFLGGGTLLSLGVHALDYVEWFLGPAARLRGRLEHRIVSTADSGCVVELEASGASAHILLAAAVDDPEGHVVALRGDRGSIVLENRDVNDYIRSFELRLEADRVETRPPVHTEEDGRLAPFAALAERIISAVRNGGPCTPAFADGLRVQHLVDAVEKAHRTSGWIDVAPRGIGRDPAV
jgi:predicted dehydrogenase